VTDKRAYGQFCGLATALDLVGERWTLLIIRELLLGSARFSELSENLPGIGPNLLSSRLQTLVAGGIAESAPVSGDGRGRGYRLTEAGEQLRRPVLSLARWGLHRLDHEAMQTGYTRAAWGFLAVEAMILDAPVPQIDEVYEFRVEKERFHIRVEGGSAVAGRGCAPDSHPSVVATTDAETFVRIGAELLSPFEAAVTGKLTIEGDYEAIERCTRLMGLATGMSRRRNQGTS